MVLMDFSEANGWIKMNWQCSFTIGWSNIIKSANRMREYFDNMRITVGAENKRCRVVDISSEDVPEEEMLVLEGMCNVFNNVPMQFIFKTDTADVSLVSTSQFPKDYESIAKGYGQFVDMMELLLYTANTDYDD